MKNYRITDANLVSFNSDLFSELHSGKRKNMSNIYILVIRKYGWDNSLIYSYISYPISFKIALLYYFATRVNILNDKVHSEWGNFICFLDKTLDPSPETNIWKYNNNYLFKESVERDYRNQSNLVSEYSFTINKILRLTYLLSTDKIVEIIDCAYKHDIYKMFKEYLWLSDGPCNKEKLFSALNQIEVNTLHRMIFVTTDLTEFLYTIKSKGYTINGGPQKGRDKVNEMEAILTTLDAEFREALYCNYMHNVSLKIVQHVLSRKHFSFKNIHMKLGELKY